MMAQEIDDECNYMMTNPIRVVSMDQHPEVVAWFSAEMPEHWFYAMRLKWANDLSVAKKLEHKLWMIAVDICNRHGWKVPTGREYLRKMARMAIAEVADTKRFNKPGSYQLRVAWMGCDRKNWDRTWKARYDLIYREFEDWTNRAYRWMRIHPEKIRQHAERRKARTKVYLHPMDAIRLAKGSQLAQLETKVVPIKPGQMELNWAALGRPVLGVRR